MIVIYILIAVFVVLLAVIAARPAEFKITRSATILAPADAVFAQVNDLHRWEAWSPWAKLDPNAANTYEGPAAGVGAAFAWAGNRQVGEGRMTITESLPDNLIRLKLDFVKPMKASNIAEFSFQSAGNQTRVCWSMSGRNNFMGKAFGLFVNVDNMCGAMFEKGLSNMKSLVEAMVVK